ncbi:hypothetical protein ACRAWD_03220 [Caulobacter segnis]
MKAPRRLLWALGLPLLAFGGFWLWVYWPSGQPSPKPERPHDEAGYLPSQHVSSIDPPSAPPPVVGAPERCDGTDAPDTAAAVNAASLSTLAWSPFGRPETGWEIYAPRIAAEIGTTCGPGSNGFASALARWQGRRASARPASSTPRYSPPCWSAGTWRGPSCASTARGRVPARRPRPTWRRPSRRRATAAR